MAGILFLSCEKPATIPSYVKIESIELDTELGEGTDSHKITEAWITVNGNPKGAYELPAEFPILEEGEVDLIVKPGIRLNGISTTRLPYPLFTERTYNLNLYPDSSIELSPRVKYTDATVFEWMEPFEDPGFSLEASNKSDTTFTLISDPNHVFEGNNSVAFFMDEDHSFFEGISTEAFELPTVGDRRIFLEMNYKCDHPFTVGIFANEPQSVSQESILLLNEKEEWNKIYINLGPNVFFHPNALNFKIFFGAVLTESDSAAIYLDNIKLVYR